MHASSSYVQCTDVWKCLITASALSQELSGGGCCKGRSCGGLRSGGAQWYRPLSLTELASVFSEATQSNKTVKLVCGDTGRGERW